MSAAYSGDTNFAASTSVALTQTARGRTRTGVRQPPVVGPWVCEVPPVVGPWVVAAPPVVGPWVCPPVTDPRSLSVSGFLDLLDLAWFDFDFDDALVMVGTWFG